jgi:hypothetical protein
MQMFVWWRLFCSFMFSTVFCENTEIPFFANLDCVDVVVNGVDWSGHVFPMLRDIAHAENAVVNVTLLDTVIANRPLHMDTVEGCPLGVLSIALLQAYRLTNEGKQPDADTMYRWLRSSFLRFPWYMVAQSRWPFFELLANYFDAPAEAGSFQCCAKQASVGVMNWTEVQKAGTAFVEDNGGEMETAEAIGRMSNELFSKGNAMIDLAMEECMCGVVFLGAVQALSAAARLSQYFPSWSRIVEDFLVNVPFEVYVDGKDWRIAEVLVMFADLNKGDKYISYTASGDKLRRRYSDLSPLVADAMLPVGRDELKDNLDLMEILVEENVDVEILFEYHANQFLREAARVIQHASFFPLETSRRTVLYTMVYGSKWTPLIRESVRQFARIGIPRVLFVTLGLDALAACRQISVDIHVATEISCLEFPSLFNSQLHRYTAAHVAVYLGFDVFYFDLDTFFFRSPFPAIAATLEQPGRPINEDSRRANVTSQPQLLISSHADGNCVNVGFFYIKASRGSAEFLTLFVNWYHLHSYEIDQRGMDAFLRHSTTIDASFIPPRVRRKSQQASDELVMHYAILDDINQFIIPGVGWLGNFSDVVVAHYCEWDFERKLEDLNFLYNRSLEDAEVFFGKYKLDAPRERLECW